MSNNVRVALIVFAATLLWFASGLLRNPPSEELQEASKAQQTAVKAAWFEARAYASGIAARGQTEPNRTVTLRAEVAGRVEAVPAERGELVAQGDLICQLAKEDRGERVAEARAGVAEAKLQYQGALKLKDKGYQSDVAIAQAKARLDSATANLKRSELELSNTEIRAPFAGVLEIRQVEVGDFMDRVSVCGTLLEVSPLKATAQVSEQKVQQINFGSVAQVVLANGETINGKVSYVSQQASEGTRTYRVEVTIPNADARLRAGLTAQLLIPTREVQAHLVPSVLLSLADDGSVGLRILDDENRVQYTAVQIIGDDPKGVWVSGLPERALLITVGQEYVANGEEVSVTLEGEAYTGLLSK